jgi:hypothetical protein
VAQAEKFQGIVRLEETRLALFNANIREILLEMNNEDANVRLLMDDYARLEQLMRGAPDISDWGMKIFKESIRAEMPDGAILELGKSTGESASPN